MKYNIECDTSLDLLSVDSDCDLEKEVELLIPSVIQRWMYLGGKKEENTRGNLKRGGKNTTSFVWQLREVSSKSDNGSKIVLQKWKISDIDQK